MRNNYKSDTRQMTDEQVLAKIQFYHKYLFNHHAGTSNLTKSLYFENEAKKRGYTAEQITDYCNKKDIEELATTNIS